MFINACCNASITNCPKCSSCSTDAVTVTTSTRTPTSMFSNKQAVTNTNTTKRAVSIQLSSPSRSIISPISSSKVPCTIKLFMDVGTSLKNLFSSSVPRAKPVKYNALTYTNSISKHITAKTALRAWVMLLISSVSSGISRNSVRVRAIRDSRKTLKTLKGPEVPSVDWSLENEGTSQASTMFMMAKDVSSINHASVQKKCRRFSAKKRTVSSNKNRRQKPLSIEISQCPI
mmetsp:Transcript_69784/g.130351  ORF Transcript_69784/g.130351 Transcript_69784/m.130351 type:complete len:231 (+) Transcript_69784:501-1193(+)